MKKTISIILSIILMLSSLAVFSGAVSETVYKDGDVEFVVRDKKAYVTAVTATDNGDVIIPAKVCAKADNIISSGASTFAIGDDDNDADDPFGDDYIYVDSIEDNAFDSVADTMLTLSIPRYVTNISIDALRVPALKSIVVNANNANYYTFAGSLYTANKTSFLFHPESSTDSTILTSVKTIASGAFKDSKKIESVTIPDFVTAINDNTFDGCTALKTVNIESSSAIISVGQYAFYNTAISSFAVPASLKTISAFAFYNCSKLASLTFGYGCSDISIGAGAFIGCPLYNLTLPRAVTSFGEHSIGYYYDADLILQKYADFAITGYKFNADKTATTALFEYTSGEGIGFIPLDVTSISLNFSCSKLQNGGTMYLYSAGELKYTLNSSNTDFSFTDIDEGSYDAYVTVKHGITVKAHDTVTVGNATQNITTDVYVPIGDVDKNGKIDVSDLASIILEENFGSNKDDYDVDGNGVVNVTDISVVLLEENYSRQSDI